MAKLPKNVRIGRNGRVGILKKVPRDLWEHPQYRDRSKVIERSTGAVNVTEGVKIACAMLQDLEQEFASARAELYAIEALHTHEEEALPDEHHEAEISPDGLSAAEGSKPPLPAPFNDSRPAPRRREAEATRRDILDAAMEEFAAKGLSGARVDAIAARTRTTKPMIYYHFGSKEKLYAAVMEEAYGGVRTKEQGLHLDALPTEEAMRRLVEVTFDHHAEHPEYVRLVTVENIEMGRHITGRKSLIERNAIAIETVQDLLRRGEAEGIFRTGINPWHLHFLISSFCFMRVSNRYSWRAVFDMDLWDEEDVPAQREMIVEAILRYVKP
ncbi:TetR/AcrR family transcriptional regulator [uncultured Cohaesibacter sp.]|uniref:TetR/AcrR family transcriptional regulator n=1 Tax=uncultured Cohaesibacter sp. TaxID=1002546 RepID=UPI0029C8E146|nr:TetR/AcrR family transcriptional regulator [uncultured Cohaesibacter sp.]